MAFLDDEWSRCRSWLAAALERGPQTHTERDILDDVIAGRLQLWPGQRSVAVTEVLTFPRCKVVRIAWAGGELDELLTVIRPAIEAWARELGCRYVWGGGRPGWERVAPEYRRFATLLSKELYE